MGFHNGGLEPALVNAIEGYIGGRLNSIGWNLEFAAAADGQDMRQKALGRDTTGRAALFAALKKTVGQCL